MNHDHPPNDTFRPDQFDVLVLDGAFDGAGGVGGEVAEVADVSGRAGWAAVGLVVGVEVGPCTKKVRLAARDWGMGGDELGDARGIGVCGWIGGWGMGGWGGTGRDTSIGVIPEGAIINTFPTPDDMDRTGHGTRAWRKDPIR